MSCICGHAYIGHGTRDHKGCVVTECKCQEYREAPDYQEFIGMIPQHLRGGMLRYLQDGIQPGHFLTAVLENNLMEAMARADEMSRAGLYSICQFLYNHAPMACYGTPETVRKWMERKREGAA